MLQKATVAKNKTVEAEGLESIQLAVMASRDDKGISTTSLAKNLSEINGLTDINNQAITEEIEITLPKSVKLNNTKYDIKKDGTVIINNKILPVEYEQVKYVESSGIQYIDTLYVSNNNTNYEIEAQVNHDTKVDGCLFGARTSGYGSQDSFILWHNTCYSADSEDIEFVISSNHKEQIIQTSNFPFRSFKYINNQIYIDNDAIKNISNELTTTNLSLYLMALNQNGTPDKRMYRGKIKYFQIYENNIIVKNFVPCYSTTSVTDVDGEQCLAGTIGMYDTVEGKFYINQGTGTFGYETEDGTYVAPTNTQ